MTNKLITEPNPAAGRKLTSRFLDEYTSYLEAQAAFGRPYGLLPARSEQERPMAYLDPPDVVKLPAIRAIGKNGFPIVAGPAFPCSHIRPLDTQSLSTGRFQVYVATSFDKVAIGGLIDKTGDAGRPSRTQPRQYRTSRVVLTVGEDRLKYRDWLQIAELDRERQGGAIRTELNRSYHPPITSMDSYCYPNPLSMFTNRVLSELDREPIEETHAHLRYEMMILQNLAESAIPEMAFAQSQRCLAMLKLMKDPPLSMDSRLDTFRYSPDTFCDFLARLRTSLDNANEVDLLPQTLEIDEKRYQKLAGEFVEKDDFWSWSLDKSSFFANGVAVYFPGAIPGTLPNIQYGRRKEDRHGFSVARASKEVSAAGVAVVLDELMNEIKDIYLAADTETMHQKLRKCLGEGHAIYYR